MCGIAGQIRRDGPVALELVHRMCQAVEHRGPDSRGIHHADGVALGIQRLRVIDLVTGDQPIYNESGDVVVVLNGEIYNFAELRDELRAGGHRFRTQGDTEVIVHLYEEYGPDCVDRLHGMFAFALWDQRRRRLLLARDRIGKKPLFYALGPHGLTFASELPAVMEDREISRQLSTPALHAFLTYGYVPTSECVFRAVRKVPPATWLVYEGGRVHRQRYWRLNYARKRKFADRESMHEEIRATIRRAVRRRLIADVPLGAFLSGGIDSSVVVAAMAEASAHPVKTFSIGFRDSRFNELAHASAVAREFGCDHHEFVVEPDAAMLAPKLVRAYGEPFADPSAIPSMYLAEVTRRSVTVALNGDGGDESFGGYSRYISNQLANRLSMVPHAARARAASVFGRLPVGGSMTGLGGRLDRFIRTIPLEPAERYQRYMSYVDPSRHSVYTSAFRAELDEQRLGSVVGDAWEQASGNSPIDVMLEVDTETYLPGGLLVKMDIATMAYGLEGRSPFLDTEVMELGAGLPAAEKVRRLETKVALREALRGWIPERILDRPKHGFSVPLGSWLRVPLRKWTEEILLDRVTVDRGYFDPSAVRAMVDRHGASQEDASLALWAMIIFELWHREFVDRSVACIAA